MVDGSRPACRDCLGRGIEAARPAFRQGEIGEERTCYRRHYRSILGPREKRGGGPPKGRRVKKERKSSCRRLSGLRVVGFGRAREMMDPSKGAKQRSSPLLDIHLASLSLLQLYTVHKLLFSHTPHIYSHTMTDYQVRSSSLWEEGSLLLARAAVAGALVTLDPDPLFCFPFPSSSLFLCPTWTALLSAIPICRSFSARSSGASRRLGLTCESSRMPASPSLPKRRAADSDPFPLSLLLQGAHSYVFLFLIPLLTPTREADSPISCQTSTGTHPSRPCTSMRSGTKAPSSRPPAR